MANEFKKNVGGQISKAEAEKMIEKFDTERKKDTKSVFFGKNVFDAIFSDTRATGVSIFFARKTEKDKDGKEKSFDDIVLVGTAEDGTLLWTNDPPIPSTELQVRSLTSGTGSSTYDTAYTCPPYCPK